MKQPQKRSYSNAVHGNASYHSLHSVLGIQKRRLIITSTNTATTANIATATATNCLLLDRVGDGSS